MAEPTETSPLLESRAESSNESVIPELSSSTGTAAEVPAREHFKRNIKTITAVILIASIMNLVLILGTDIVAKFGQFSNVRSSTTFVLELLGIFTFLSLTLAGLNTRYLIAILLNIIFDISLAYAIIASAGTLISYDGWPDYGWCDSGYYQKPIPPHCSAWKLALQVLVGIVAGFGAVIGTAQLLLFVLRVVAIFRTKFWQRPWGLYFPTGEFTISLTIKLLKQEPPLENQEPAGPGVQITSA